MLSLTPCIDIFFTDKPLSVALENLSNLGFSRFEMWSWWDKDRKELQSACNKFHLQLAACCTHFISLVDPAEHSNYCDGLEKTMTFCREMGCRTIISQVGNERTDVPRKEQYDGLIAGLEASAKILAGTEFQLVIEPLNLLVDHPGYYLSRSDEAADIITTVGSEHIKMLFDIYHQQITEGNVTANLQKYAALIGHYHMADVPGRHEPGTGELNYPNILKAIAATGYQGDIGLEFYPSTESHTDILRALQLRLA